MSHSHATRLDPVQIGLVGAGRIGTSHATLLAERVPGARLVAVADPRPEAAAELAAKVGARAVNEPGEVFGDPAIEAPSLLQPPARHQSRMRRITRSDGIVSCGRQWPRIEPAAA